MGRGGQDGKETVHLRADPWWGHVFGKALLFPRKPLHSVLIHARKPMAQASKQASHGTMTMLRSAMPPCRGTAGPRREIWIIANRSEEGLSREKEPRIAHSSQVIYHNTTQNSQQYSTY